ncbi:uncharacterized protein CIMG_02378 [Coccidioides immitis RS]|uniref:N-acetyltransferase domain-containing protein n=2 Tax=Coccidioides immitis TaxID=5501 RepID=J3KL90_COCIM|nr:uncharacterized protein CIMG_02378 [Coccidioides immitis RS]EAS37024.3 hypothetical protein CIMG_02378 [Coccidioides immitis RS]KMU89465.1 hypothetical protein CIHG_07272 [Coccidioides immitis H538.4]TPX24946.1 hypothetical protein DIZ76_010395 [Coccidioides immitis]
MATSPIAQFPGFSGTLLDSDQLRAHPCLKSLQIMVNDAFREGNHDRFPTLDAVSATLGTHGRCIVIFRDTDVDKINPVATAMIKYYNPAVGVDPIGVIHANGRIESEHGYDSEPADLLSITQWEPAAVAILQGDPSLRKLGLAVYCVDQLEIDLMKRLEEARKNQSAVSGAQSRSHTSASSAKVQKLTLWIRAKQHLAPYWERRGYKLVHTKMYPKGIWGSQAELKIVTLKRDMLSSIE